ncbi:MAG: tape measure protein [Aestuariibacter sp.]|nr:tape measure protein [Aestuariibacter sp.]
MAKSVTIDFNARLTKFEAGIDKATNRVNRFSRNVKRQSRSMSSAFSSLGTKIAGVFGVAAVTRSFVSINKQMEQLEKGLSVVAGSSSVAASEMEFLKRVTQELGVDILAAGDAYLQLSAAAKGTALEGQASRDIFEAVSRAMAKLGRPAEQVRGALYAIQQMISKGTISMEELRRQLGDRLPGALQLAEKALGVTSQELQKMVASGQVLAVDFLPKLTKELNNLYDDGKRIDTFNAAWSRFTTTVALSFDKIDEGTGIMKAFKVGLDEAGAALAFFTNTQNISQLSGELAKAQKELYALINTESSADGFFSGFLKDQGYYGRKIKKTIKEINSLKQRIDEVKGPDVTPTGTNELKAAGDAAKTLGEETKKLFDTKAGNPLDGMASDAAKISKTFNLIGNALTIDGKGGDAKQSIEDAAAAINKLAKEGTVAEQTIKDMTASLNEARTGKESPELKIIATLEENASGKLLTATDETTQKVQAQLKPLIVKVIADYSEINNTMETIQGGGTANDAEAEGGRQ